MGGIFGVVSKTDCKLDVFFGTDYHSHLGTSRGGMAFHNGRTFVSGIHNIRNSPFRTKFEHDLERMSGRSGIGCISDSEPQPLIIRSHLGSYAISTVGRISNLKALSERALRQGKSHFLEMSTGDINATELVAALINECDTIADGILYAQSCIEGSMTMLILTPDGLYAARDKRGRTPLSIGTKEGAHCVSFESFAYLNLGYNFVRDLGPGEVVYISAEHVEQLVKPSEEMKVCSFLWIYYGYPTSSYEGLNVESIRYRCGAQLAKRDKVKPDLVAGVPDSGTAHAIGYANQSGIPFSRPFIKYTPTWPRSFMPIDQSLRNLIARMKIIPIESIIRGKSLLLIDDSIVRGTQLRETTEFLYQCGATEVHIRPACPPLLHSCPYLNFSRASSILDLITRRIIREKEGLREESMLYAYANPESSEYRDMLDGIRSELNFTTLEYNRLDDMVEAIGLPADKLCTYCFNRVG